MTSELTSELENMSVKDIKELLSHAIQELDSRLSKGMLAWIQTAVVKNYEGVVLRPKEKRVQIRLTAKTWEEVIYLLRLNQVPEYERASIQQHVVIDEGEDSILVLFTFRAQPSLFDFMETDMTEDDTEISIQDFLDA